MKKALLILLALSAMLTSRAQAIREGDKFFNGRVLYTVQQIRSGGVVYLTGAAADGDYHEMTLESVTGKSGFYTLQPSAKADDSPITGAGFGDTVQYVRSQGMNFLAVSGTFDGLADILVKTPDNLENCIGQQEFAETQSVSELTGDLLFNRALLDPVATAGLEILAKKLKKNNPSIIETYNLKLIQGMIAYREAMEIMNNPDGLGADGRGQDEIEAEKAVIERITLIFKDVARRNAGGEGNPTPEDIEKMYTTRAWRSTVAETLKKDSRSDDIGFYDHDYWTFSQNPSPDLTIKKIIVEESYGDRATAFVRFVNWPGDKPQTMWIELIKEDGELRINNFRDYDDELEDGYFDYMKEMREYLGE